MLKEQKYTILVLLAFFVWAIISSIWYTCGLKGFCQDKAVVKEKQEVKKVIEIEDDSHAKFISLEDINTTKAEKAEVKVNKTEKTEVVKTTTEHQRISCMTYINSKMKLKSSSNIKSEVVKLQKFLNKYNDAKLSVDGVFGSDVKSAVIKFQKTNKIKTDGEVGVETRRMINTVYCIENSKN